MFQTLLVHHQGVYQFLCKNIKIIDSVNAQQVKEIYHLKHQQLMYSLIVDQLRSETCRRLTFLKMNILS